jgi:hypothetical protein
MLGLRYQLLSRRELHLWGMLSRRVTAPIVGDNPDNLRLRLDLNTKF